MASAKGVGIPVKLLHEAEGHVVTVELKSGENYRGELIEAEDNWNCQMKNVQATAKVRTGCRTAFIAAPELLFTHLRLLAQRRHTLAS